MNQGRTSLLFLLLVILIFAIPAILITITGRRMEETGVEVGEIGEFGEEYFSPSQIMADKDGFKDEFVVVRGLVEAERVACERGTCPKTDPCCGCPVERNLVIVDAGTSVLRQVKEKLLLLSLEGEPLCYRVEGGCDYYCPGWEEGAVYEIRGIFRTTPPPKGTAWTLHFDNHLVVEEYELIKSVGLFDQIASFVNDLKNYLTGIKGGTYYIVD